MDYQWHDFVGNLGVGFVLICYFLLQVERMDNRGFAFSALNGVGALFIMVSLYFNFNLSSFIIECAWLAISLYGLYRWLLDSRRQA